MEELIWSISRLVKAAPPAVIAGGDGKARRYRKEYPYFIENINIFLVQKNSLYMTMFPCLPIRTFGGP